MTDQWRWLTESQRTWRVTQAGAVLTPYQHKRNAGASALISSIAAAASFSGPDRLKTNITIPSIVADKSALYLPDRLLVRDGKRFSDVSYEHLGVYQTTQRFIEESVPPADAQHVDTTWTYVNKDGGPGSPVQQQSDLAGDAVRPHCLDFTDWALLDHSNFPPPGG